MQLKLKSIFRVYLLLSIILLHLSGCSWNSGKDTDKETAEYKTKGDLGEILDKNQLTVLAENSATSYFIYRGQKMGLEYEILYHFAKELGVKLEVKIIDDLDNIITDLNNYKADIIACNYTVTKERQKQINFSIPISQTSQVLVQRKPEDWKKLKKSELEKMLIREPNQLIEKTIYVWQNSSYYKRLINLQDELGDTIYLKALNGDIIPERALEMVEKGFIDYTIVDDNVAKINKFHFPNLDTEFEISIKQRIAFGLRKESTTLKKRLDDWLQEFMKSPTYRYIKHKYLSTSEYNARSMSEYSSISGNKISPYDDIIKSISAKYNWDWRLIAALIYQESKFIENLESWAGAYGLMQFMPEVGPSYNVYPDSPVEEQIDGGIRKLIKDFDAWKSIPDSIQRIKFALATYNAGLGHILDAQRLTKKDGKNPLVWDENVENYIKRLSDPEYYKAPEVYYGYIRGIENYNFVREIMIRYNEYVSLFP